MHVSSVGAAAWLAIVITTVQKGKGFKQITSKGPIFFMANAMIYDHEHWHSSAHLLVCVLVALRKISATFPRRAKKKERQ